jgi:polar amino acid transport system permease protein
VVKARHTGRWVACAVILIIAAMAVYSMFTNKNFQWAVVGKYLFDPTILAGLGNTLVLTVVAMLLGIVLGVVIAVGRLSPNPVLSWSAALYSWFFRGTPLLVQLLFWYFLAALIPKIIVGVPFGPQFFAIDTNSVISAFTAAILGLGLNEAAYMSEIVRSGIGAVSPGQTEAAKAIGMNRIETLWRIVLPQAMRIIIPPTGNETIGMLKYTSLVIVIGYAELMTTVTTIYARTYQNIPLLIVAAIWYLAITAILSVAQHFIERHYARGFRPHTAAKRSLPSLATDARPIATGASHV